MASATSVSGLLRTMQILYGALFASVGIYAVVVHVVGTEVEADVALNVELYFAVLGGLAIATMLIIRVFRAKLMPPSNPPQRLDATPDGGTLPKSAQQALGQLMTASILTWALCEAIALYGLVLSFLSGDPNHFWLFGGLSALNLLLYRPTRAQVEGVVRAALQADR